MNSDHPSPRGPRIGSLFSGYGGLDLAVEAVLGGHLSWCAEVDRHACAVLERRWPGVVNLGDVTTIDWDQVEPVDVLTAGFPCTDISNAGKRVGITGRSPASGDVSWTPFARYDRRSSSWRTSPRSSGGGSTSSTPAWPRSGTTRGGYAFAPATSALLTGAIECSCWPLPPSDSTQVVTLPTPCARDGKGPGHQYGLPDMVEPHGSRHALLPTPTAVSYGSNRSPSPGATRRPGLHQLAGQLLPTPTVADSRSSANATAGRTTPLQGHAGRTLTDAARLLPTSLAADGRRLDYQMAGGNPTLLGTTALLPTPRASDGTKGCPGQRGSHGDLTLPLAAVRVLPTPTASDGRGPGGRRGGGVNLRTTVAELGQLDEARWGQYAAAVARWELLLGRGVPEPTQPGRHGKPVLAPPFVEWLMGLPERWVTDPQLGLPRTRALRVLGNGVVPQQAAAALCLLLDPDRWAVPA